MRERFPLAQKLAEASYEAARTTGEERMIAEGLVMVRVAQSAIGDKTPGLTNLREGVARHRAANGKRALPQALTYLLEAVERAGALALEAVDELTSLDIARAPFPAKTRLAIGKFYAMAGNSVRAREQLEAGRLAVRSRLAELAPDDAKAYRALPFCRALLRPTRPGASPSLAITASQSNKMSRRSSRTLCL